MILVAKWGQWENGPRRFYLSEIVGWVPKGGSDTKAILLHEDGKLGLVDITAITAQHMTRAQLKRERALLIAEMALK